MSKLLQLRGGTTTEHATFTGALREVTVDTTKDTLVIHDGASVGGFPLPRTDADIRAAVEAATDSNVFTDADHTKLNAIEAFATADQTAAEIRAAVEAATDSNVFTDADHTKLNSIEASADVTDTVNVVAALTAGANITIAANGTISGAAQYTHPTHAGDDADIDTGALSGATVISDLDFNITTDTLGHVTDANATVSTRNLTLGDLGYTGATNANYITNNNQLTNGAGYITSSGINNLTGLNAKAIGSYPTKALSASTNAVYSLASNLLAGDVSMIGASLGIPISYAQSNVTEGNTVATIQFPMYSGSARLYYYLKVMYSFYPQHVMVRANSPTGTIVYNSGSIQFSGDIEALISGITPSTVFYVQIGGSLDGNLNGSTGGDEHIKINDIRATNTYSNSNLFS
jgi:hypothetical protein